MSAVAVLLISLGATELIAPSRLRARIAATWVAISVSAAIAGMWTVGDIGLLAGAGLAVTAWSVLCRRVTHTNSHHTAPLLTILSAIAMLTALSGWATPAGGLLTKWIGWVALPAAEDLGPDKILMLVGVVLGQLTAGNTAVRLILGSVGAVRPTGQPQPSDRLRGGRLLGPMERLAILGFAGVGQIAAAAVIVAAKGLIRFPELTAQRRRPGALPEDGSGIDAVTEYFLVGSFASWLLATAGAGLIFLS